MYPLAVFVHRSHSITMPETAFRDLHVRLIGLGWEQRLRRIREEGREGEEHGHHRPLTLQQPPNRGTATEDPQNIHLQKGLAFFVNIFLKPPKHIFCQGSAL